MPDLVFDEPRLADVYDALDPDRSDLDAYVSVAREVGARSAVDVGCGTGTLACLLADDGLEVVGVDPAAAMLAVARRKAGAERVRWVHGVADDLPVLRVDLVTMTGNVAQVFLDDAAWAGTLEAAHRVLRPGGTLAFESRRPQRQAWLGWTRDASFERVDLGPVGTVETWHEVVDVALPFVTFQRTIAFLADGAVRTSTSTLRFRAEDELADSLAEAGFDGVEVRDAPDRPGLELVFLAVRR